jgi:glycosyltransferase involved in cell wall biosynthesis
MKIAFDGTVLHGRKSGVGYYSEELLKAMLAGNHEDQFYVFSHRKLDLRFPSSNGNLKFTNSIHFPIRAVYLHAFLPMVLDKVQPDICHYTNFLAPISEDRPYVVTVHDMGLETLRDSHPLAKRLYTKPLVPYIARKARLVITNSEYSKWQIVRYVGIAEDRIRVTPLAASPEFKPVDSQSAVPYFLYVGNLEPRKNVEGLIEAFARMKRKDHELLIVGNRLYHAEGPEQKAQALGLGQRVKFLGYVPRSDLPRLFSGATAFVYPSLLEGFGLPVIEAMACGTPVITSNNSSMKEIGEGAALLVDPRNIYSITEALEVLAEDAALRHELRTRGLKRAAEYSWEKTAQLTLDVYREAVKPLTHGIVTDTKPASSNELESAIERTIRYSESFQYPLHRDELRERLFDVEVDEQTFQAAMDRIRYEPRSDLLRLRTEREEASDRAIAEIQPRLKTVASLPFVRMLAFSGATSHRNMMTTEDIDLFMIVEDGKLWSVFLIAMVWAKLKGLRKRLCLNYVISDAALPLFEADAFTAQQAASLKPFYGKNVYDRFIAANSFIKRWFPNFHAQRNRQFYPELPVARSKRALETILRAGPIQIAECASRAVLRRYLARQVNAESDVVMDAHRLKLHLRSHKRDLLGRI